MLVVRLLVQYLTILAVDITIYNTLTSHQFGSRQTILAPMSNFPEEIQVAKLFSINFFLIQHVKFSKADFIDGLSYTKGHCFPFEDSDSFSTYSLKNVYVMNTFTISQDHADVVEMASCYLALDPITYGIFRSK